MNKSLILLNYDSDKETFMAGSANFLIPGKFEVPFAVIENSMHCSPESLIGASIIATLENNKVIHARPKNDDKPARRKKKGAGNLDYKQDDGLSATYTDIDAALGIWAAKK